MSNAGQAVAAARYRPVALGGSPVSIERDVGGAIRVRPIAALDAYPERLLERLVAGAQKFPDRTLVARRDADGRWRKISYGEMLAGVRAIAQYLIGRGLSAQRPIAILSGNGLEHLQLAFGAMWAGIPYSPLSPAVSLLSEDHARLHHAMRLLTPGLVFADDAARYAAAIRAAVPADVELVAVEGDVERRHATPFEKLLATRALPAADAAFAGTGADSIAKFLFTSGSTNLPKAVPTTQRMLCSNQQMLLQTFPFLGDEPPVLVDWLPWHHTFGGSHNVGVVLYNGGTLYIDDGRPTPELFGETLRNLREISTTVYFNVPRGWEELVMALEADEQLRDRFYSRLKLQFFAAAGLSQAVWDRLNRVAEQHCGELIRVMSGLGMTEASPSCMFTTVPEVRSGYVGLPCPGCDLKLVPVEGKFEARFRGPHVMPGYWRVPEQTAAAFDEEGYYRSGDALKFVDADDVRRGFIFDGRMAEDFKLSSGTFVSAGPLRARLITEGAPLVQDAVIVGADRNEIGALIFPRLDRCRDLAGAGDDTPAERVLAAPAVRARFQALLDDLCGTATGSSNRVARACVLAEPASIEAGEVTDKGSINQRAVVSGRACVVDALYDDAWPELIRPSMR